MGATERLVRALVVLNVLAIVLLSGAFIAYITFVYFVRGAWAMQIASLATTPTVRLLVATHMAGGCLLMLCMPWQVLTAATNRYAARALCAHRWLGRAMTMVAAQATAWSGLAYIAHYGTVGGRPMSFGFAVYGILLLFASIVTLVSARRLAAARRSVEDATRACPHRYDLRDLLAARASHTSTRSIAGEYDEDDDDDDEDYRLAQEAIVVAMHTEHHRLKRLHRAASTTLFALVYASMLYRILYATAEMTSGYEAPPVDKPQWYARPLDRAFQWLFFALPLLAAAGAEIVARNGQRSMRIAALAFGLAVQVFAMFAVYFGTARARHAKLAALLAQ